MKPPYRDVDQSNVAEQLRAVGVPISAQSKVVEPRMKRALVGLSTLKQPNEREGRPMGDLQLHKAAIRLGGISDLHRTILAGLDHVDRHQAASPVRSVASDGGGHMSGRS